MYRFIGEATAYSFFNSIAIYVMVISSLFLFNLKKDAMGLYSRHAIFYASRKNLFFGKFVKIFLTAFELILLDAVIILSTNLNRPFGDAVGTGANYFGALFVSPIILAALSCVMMANPLKQLDIATLLLPIFLFFVKLACFFNGCCWGIPWEYGPYNYHYDHPGNQVPVQAIEAFWALLILVILLIYRKKAKIGTMFPMYMILYSATRFCSEFLRREENVLWIFKTYHLLCLAGIVIGLVLLFVVKRYGSKISTFFDNKHAKLDLKIAEYENSHKDEIEAIDREKAIKAEKKRIQKEREKKNKKLYAKSRKL